jgi:hypothetical protein
MGTSNDRERYRRAYRALPWVVISLTILALLLRPLLGRIPGDAGPAQQDKGRCDEKGIQKAKDDYAKALKERADADNAADAIAAKEDAAYEEANAAFDEYMGAGKNFGGQELNTHIMAKLGSNMAEKLAPTLTVLELAELAAEGIKVIYKDTTVLSKAGDMAERYATETGKAMSAIEAAQAALRRQRMLEAECEAAKKRKSSSRTSNDYPDDWKTHSFDLAIARPSQGTLHGRVFPVSEAQRTLSTQFVVFSPSRWELLGIADPAPQSYEMSDLVKMASREGARKNAYHDATGRYTDTKMWFGMAGEAFSQMRNQLPSPAETNHEKLTGSKLSECTKWLKMAFQDISKGVDSFDGIKSDLEKARQEN